MGYFDALVEGSFKTSAEGRALFFPWGALGRGLEIPDEREHQRIRNFLRRFYIVTVVAMIALARTTPLWVPLALAAFLFLLYAGWMRRTTSGWQRATERLSLREAQQNTARQMNGAILGMLLLSSAAILAASLFFLVALPEARLIAAGTALFGGCGCFVFLRMLRMRRTTRVAHLSAPP